MSMLRRISTDTERDAGEATSESFDPSGTIPPLTSVVVFNSEEPDAKRALARLTHGINNDIATLSMSLECFERQVGQTPEQIIANMKEAICRIIRALKIARVGGNLERLSVFPIDLTQWLGSFLNAIQISFGQKINITTNIPHRGVYVGADPDCLYEILLNLVKNTVESTSNCPNRQSELEIGIKTNDDGNVIVYVSDNGTGFPDEVIKQLVAGRKNVASTKGGGHGVGLSLCQDLLKKMGARIDVSNNCGDAKNETACGATVSLIFPPFDISTAFSSYPTR
jgi:signal transduction histidine kinase